MSDCEATLGPDEEDPNVYHCALSSSHFGDHVDRYGVARWANATDPEASASAVPVGVSADLGADQRPTIDELIARSSLGTPEAAATRDECPPDVLARVMVRLDEIDRERDAARDRVRAAIANRAAGPLTELEAALLAYWEVTR